MRSITLATGFVAIAGYAIIWIASKALSPDGYVAFMVFWGLFFALTGLIDGLLQETARAVTAAHTPPTAHSPERPERSARPALSGRSGRSARPARPFRVTFGFALACAALGAFTTPLWVATLQPGAAAWGSVLAALGLGCYAFQATLCGLISAVGAWRHFAWLIAIDSGIRLALALVAWQLGYALVAFLIITVIGAGTWLAFLAASPYLRSQLSLTADVTTPQFISRSIQSMIASGANAVLITGFPVLLRFTSTTDVPAAALAGTITAVTLTRAPLLVPLQRFQPALIVHFTRNRGHVLRAAWPPMCIVIGIAAGGAGAAWLIGQWLMGLFFDEAYLVSAAALAALTLASAATALLMISGSAALAAERHGLYWAGWVLATIAAIGFLLFPLSPEMRAVIALGLGPLVGVGLQLVALARR